MTAEANRPRYTPGPYSCHRDKDGVFDTWNIVAESDGRVLAMVHFWDGDDDPSFVATKEADARLFAAAPELLDAVKQLLDVSSRLPTTVLDADHYAVEERAWLLVSRIERTG